MYAAVALALLAAQPNPKEEPKLDPFVAKAVEPDAKDSPIRKLQKERVCDRALAVALTRQVIQSGRWQPSDFADYSKLQGTLAENLAELMDRPADKVRCYEMRLDAAREFERLAKTRVDAGAEPPQNYHLAKAGRIDAEIDLMKLKDALNIGK
jgi:hypothetical protein